jgi:hypothetical protein
MSTSLSYRKLFFTITITVILGSAFAANKSGNVVNKKI